MLLARLQSYRLIAERHRPALHRLRIDNGSMFLKVGDRFQNYLFWRFAEAFVRRIDRMTGRAVSLHDKQYISVGDIAALRRWRNGGEEEPATVRNII